MCCTQNKGHEGPAGGAERLRPLPYELTRGYGRWFAGGWLSSLKLLVVQKPHFNLQSGLSARRPMSN